MQHCDIHDPKYSVPLDVHRWSDYPEVNEFIDLIFEAHFSGDSQIRKRNLKVVLLSLYCNWRDDPEICTAVAMGSGFYKAKSRYNELHISKLTPLIVHKLKETGLVHMKKGFHDPQTNKGFVTRIWPARRLVQYFEDAEFGDDLITDHSERESILLRDKNKKNIEYKDTPETCRMRSILTAYNQLLARTHIACSHIDGPYILKPDGIKVWVGPRQSKHIHRIFNNGNFKSGGRFYGGWWMQIGPEHRSRIRIDGERCIEVDYSSMHLGLLYAKMGINYWEDATHGDMYVLEIPELDMVPEHWQRQLIKEFILICLNTKTEREAFAAFRSEKSINIQNSVMQDGWRLPRCTNQLLGQILQAFRKRHKPISSYLCSGIGSTLQYIDSCIAARLIEDFTELKTPILTVHDSFIVQERHAERLRDAMLEAWSKEVQFYDAEAFDPPSTRIKQTGYVDELAGGDDATHQEISRIKEVEYVSQFYWQDLERHRHRGLS